MHVQPLKEFVDLSDCIIVVVRYGKGGELKNSRPCDNCIHTMKQYKIKKVIYSDTSGSMVIEKPGRMDFVHMSSGWKAFKEFNSIK